LKQFKELSPELYKTMAHDSIIHWTLLNTRNENIYALRVGILSVLKILWHFDPVSPYGHDLHTIKSSLRKRNKNMWFTGDLNCV
jgi:hypothetical protein